MPKLGFDCQIILDGNGYFIEPGSYKMTRRRNYAASQTPGKIVKVAGTEKGSVAVTIGGGGSGSNAVSFFPPFTAPPSVLFATLTPPTLGHGRIHANNLTGSGMDVHVSGAEHHSVVQVEWQATPPAAIVTSELPPPAGKNAGTPHRIVDRGPYMRTWDLVILCSNTLKRYDGSPMGAIGQQLRDQLEDSYDKVATSILFRDPSGVQHSVLFASYAETVQDLRTQLLGIPYLAHIQLIENDR